MTNPHIAAIVLAAGEGTRLKSKSQNQNKVTLNLNGKPMISYTIDLLEKCGFDQIITVVGYASESVKKALGNRVDYAYQEKRNGTGHAAECGLSVLKPDIDYVLVLHGDDSAFYQPQVLQKLINTCQNHNLDMAVLTICKTDPFGIGRIIRDEQGRPKAIVEEKNASQAQKKITEVNPGMYCFKTSFIKSNIAKIKFNPIANERYLTDILAIAYDNNFKAETVKIRTDKYWHGVNTDEQLELAIKKMAQKHGKTKK